MTEIFVWIGLVFSILACAMFGGLSTFAWISAKTMNQIGVSFGWPVGKRGLIPEWLIYAVFSVMFACAVIGAAVFLRAQ